MQNNRKIPEKDFNKVIIYVFQHQRNPPAFNGMTKASIINYTKLQSKV